MASKPTLLHGWPHYVAACLLIAFALVAGWPWGFLAVLGIGYVATAMPRGRR